MFRRLFTQTTALARRAARLLEPVAPLATRLFLGFAFLQTGLGKWRNFGATVSFFSDLGLPLPEANAALVASVELVGGALLVVGFSTRLFAALLSLTMVVALLTADRGALLLALTPGAEQAPVGVVPLVYLLFLGWLVAFGPGRLSADHLWVRRRERLAKRERLRDPTRPLDETPSAARA